MMLRLMIAFSFTLPLAESLTSHQNCAGEKKHEEKKVESATDVVIQGELINTDPKDKVRKGCFCKPHPFKMVKGKSYQVDLRSKDFDAYLRLENPAGQQVAFDDDGGGNRDARIIYRAPQTGDYQICATSYGAGSTGKFILTVKEILPVKDAQGTIRVLWIGNSYTSYNDLPNRVGKLAKAGGQSSLVQERETPGGCTLENHWKNGRALTKLRAREWDFVVLQEHSQLPLKNSTPMFEYAKKFDNEIQKQGAKTLLYLPWPLANAPQNQEKLTKLHQDLATEIKARVAPVGIAWANALAADKPPTLYLSDKVHPTRAGSYLAACVFYATIYGKSAEGLPGEIGGLDNKDAKQIQAFAWQAVQDLSKRERENKK